MERFSIPMVVQLVKGRAGFLAQAFGCSPFSVSLLFY